MVDSSSRTSQQDEGSLDGPIRPKAADRIGRQSLGPARPADLQHVKGTRQRQGSEDEGKLAQLDSPLKKSSASGISVLGTLVVDSRLAKPNPCSRPNRRATTQG